MARSIPRSFYRSKKWQRVRDYQLTEHPFCEECLKRGIHTPAVIVHHVVWLTADNYKDPYYSLNPDNLESVCQTCHNRIHDARNCRKDLCFDKDGRLVKLEVGDDESR